MKFARSLLLSIAIASMSFTLTACGENDDRKASVAKSDSPATKSQVASKLAGPAEVKNEAMHLAVAVLTPEQQAELKTRGESFKQGIDSEIERANSHPQRTEQLAYFVSRQLRTVADIRKRVPSIQDFVERGTARLKENPNGGPGSSPADVNRLAGQLALMLTEIEVRQQSAIRAASVDPLVSEAYKRWISNNAPQPDVGEITKGLLDKPCILNFGENTEGGNPIAIRNVSMGMTEAEVLRAACASSAGKMLLIQRDTSDMPANPLPDGSMPPVKRYTSRVRVCFDCEDANERRNLLGADELSVNFAPSGRATSLERRQTFYQPRSPSQTQELRQPIKLSILLDSMQQKLGNPSFLYNDGSVTRVGWVYLDGKTPLPQEFWYFRKVGINQGVTQLAADKQLHGVSGTTREQLRKFNPRATYCIQKYAPGLRQDTANTLQYFRYGKDDQSRDDAFKSGWRGKPKPLTYDARYEAVGLVEKCGTVVMASFSKQQDTVETGDYFGQGGHEMVDRNANVYWFTMVMKDANAIEADLAQREKDKTDAEAQREAHVEKAASAPTKAFVP